MKLRAGVSLQARGERWVVLDPAFAREVPVGALSRALVGVLARREVEPEVLVAAVAVDAGASPEDVRGALRALLLLGLVADSGAPAALAERARGAPRPPARVLPQARFGCQASGQCCRIFRPGPLSEPDLAGLAAARPAVEEAYPDLAGEWVEDLAAPGETPRRYLRRREGQCMFLLEDHRCAIHAAAGFELKPEPCRAFPYDAVRTLHGDEDALRVFDVSHCSAQLLASETGPSHAEAAPATVALADPQPRLFHPLVLLGAGLPCDYSLLWPLEERLLELQTELTWEERLPRALACAKSYVDALGSCALTPTGPRAAARAALERTPSAPAPPEPTARAAAWVAIAAGLGDVLQTPEEREAPLADAAAEALALAQALALSQAGLLDEPAPLVEHIERVALPQERARALLAGVWRNRLFGARLLVQGHLEAGLLRLVLLEVLTQVGARARAAARGEDQAEVADLEAAHWAAATVLDREALRPALIRLGPKVWSLA